MPHRGFVREESAVGIKSDASRHQARGYRVAGLGGEVGEEIKVSGGVSAPRHPTLQNAMPGSKHQEVV